MAVSFETTKAADKAGFAALLEAATASHLRAIALLMVVTLLALLPGFGKIPPVDRDEARFAQATKQMLETGDYVDIRFQGEARYKKPVGIYWLQAGVVKVAEGLGMRRARITIWLYRIPSLVGAVGAVLLTYWAALAFVSRRGAVLAGLMLATSMLLGFEARLAKTDAMLLLTCVATMGAMARVYLRARLDGSVGPWLLPAVFWTALAGGVLLKGPVIFLFVGLTIVTLAITDRSLSWLRALRPLAGIGWLLLLVLPWFIAIVLRSGDSFFAQSVGGDFLSKIGAGQESHGMPPGVYFLLFWLTFFPGSMMAALAAPAIWKVRREPGAKFLLAWVVPAWIVLELTITKLPHYILPVYPAIAILVAGVIDHHGLSRNPWLTRGTVWWLLIVGILFGVALAAHIVIGEQAGVAAWPFGIAAIILALFAWWLYRVDGPEVSFLRAATAAILISMTLFGATFPSIPELFPSMEFARALRGSGCKSPTVATAGYYEPSIVFLGGTDTVMADGPIAAEFLAGGTCRFALIDTRYERSFALRAEAIGLRYFAGPHIDGFNISNGHRISLAVFHSALAP